MQNNDEWGWVDAQEEKSKEERAKGYFNIQEGSQQFVLLSNCAPLPQVWDGKRYRIAVEGDTNVSIKGLCWVLQDGLIKEAKLPYTLVKEIRGLQQNPDWEFEIPFLHTFTLNAKGANTKEVKYSINASPKRVDIPLEILEELKKKPTPEELVEKIKGKKQSSVDPTDYPEEDIDTSNIPF